MLRIDADRALIQTVDFFTPVVDDPRAYGEIAAANALSDVYAMGGRPLSALSIAAFPEADFPLEWAAAIAEGGHAKLREAGCHLLGGHTVRDAEIKFGYAVTGLVDPAEMMTNAGASVGDQLVLTKPLGTGIIATALKAGVAPDDVVAEATDSMRALNAAAAQAARASGARAATDITGFGLVGHALEVAEQSHVRLEIDAASLPRLKGVEALAATHQAGGLLANASHFEPRVSYARTLDAVERALLYDPQTSGGLLIFVPEAGLAGAPRGSAGGPPGRPRLVGRVGIDCAPLKRRGATFDSFPRGVIRCRAFGRSSIQVNHLTPIRRPPDQP